MTTPAKSNDNFKETPIGMFPEDWEITTIGELFDIQQGKSLSPKHREGKSPHPFLRTANLYWGKIDLTRLDQMDFTVDEVAKMALQPGDLLTCEGGDIGRTAMWRGEMESCCYQNHLHRLRTSRTDVYPEFFMYWLQAAFTLLGLYSGEGNKTTIPNLSQGRLKAFQVPKPSITEQCAIAKTLSAVRRDIEATEAVIAAACETKRAMMKHLFTYGAISGEQVVSISLQETDIGDMPNGWDVIRLEAVIETAEYGLNNRAELIGTYPVFRMNNLVDGKVDTTNLKYVELRQSEFVKYRLEKGDVLFNRTNSLELVGKTSLFDLDGDFVFASYLVRVKSKKDKLLPSFLNYYLNWEITQQRLRGLATRGVSQSNISAGKLRTFEILLPSIPEQNDIVIVLESIDAKIQAESQRKLALEALFESLLDQLMTGKLRTMYPITYNIPASKSQVISEAPSLHLLEAALLAAIIAAQVQRGSHSASRFRNTKLNYFYDGAAERDEALAAYSKQPNGPYDYHKRHDGIEDEMVRRGFARLVDDTHFAPGPNIAEALSIVETSHKPAVLRHIMEQFHKYRDNTLELWATVDYTARELHQRGEFVSAEKVIAAWKQEPQWEPKTAKFTVEDVRKALRGLSLFWGQTPW